MSFQTKKVEDFTFSVFDNCDFSIETIRARPDCVNWRYICKYQKLTIEELKEFQDYIHWDLISENCSEEIIDEFKDKVNWSIILWKKHPEEFLRKYVGYFNSTHWHKISASQTLSEDFIREFSDKVGWISICSTQHLSENFIKEFQDKVDWYCISHYQTLSEDFIREFQHKIHWRAISLKELSKEFVCEFYDKLNWNDVFINNTYTNMPNHVKVHIALNYRHLLELIKNEL